MRRTVFAFLCFMVFSSLCSAQDADYPYKEDLPFYSISEINHGILPQGHYNTEGYVLLISTCPPCPAGAHCETCLIDHLLISETDRLSNVAGSRIRDRDLILFARDLTHFKKGEKYRFSIRISKAYQFDAKYMTGYSNRFEIIGFRHSALK